MVMAFHDTEKILGSILSRWFTPEADIEEYSDKAKSVSQTILAFRYVRFALRNKLKTPEIFERIFSRLWRRLP
jgi:hypothetical protein